MATTAKFGFKKFSGTNDFSLWRIKMKALLVHNGLADAINKEAMASNTDSKKMAEIDSKAHSAILLSLRDEVLREVGEEGAAMEVWNKLEGLYLKKSLANRLYLKKSLYSIHMEEGKDLRKHMDDFNKIILDIKNIDIKIEEEDQAILLLSSLPKPYEHFVDTMLYGKQTLTMAEVKYALMSEEFSRKHDAKDEINVRVDAL